jgi:D-glycero-D-manno-heptose 1,7-bisphosphate phosphatase
MTRFSSRYLQEVAMIAAALDADEIEHMAVRTGDVGALAEGRGATAVSHSTAVFLGRDGVLNDAVVDPVSDLYESPYRAEDVRLAAGAVGALNLLSTVGLSIVVVSNQPAAAKGTHSHSDLEAVHSELVRQLAKSGVRIDVWRHCPHHPSGVDPDLGRACECRKPSPGLILEAADAMGIADLSSSWVIGDSDVDIAAGRAAGCRTILVEHAATAHRRTGAYEPDLRVDDVLAAAQRIAGATARMGEIA